MRTTWEREHWIRLLETASARPTCSRPHLTDSSGCLGRLVLTSRLPSHLGPAAADWCSRLGVVRSGGQGLQFTECVSAP